HHQPCIRPRSASAHRPDACAQCTSGSHRRSGEIMAITVKRVSRNIEQTSYVKATLQGMALTLKQMFEPKVTIQYPEQKWELSPRWRGTHRMLTKEDGKARCVACGPASAHPTASSSSQARTRTGIATHSFSRSTNFVAYSADTARKCVRKTQSMWASTTTIRSTAEKGTCTIWRD